jgi:hypothetical protein
VGVVSICSYTHVAGFLDSGDRMASAHVCYSNLFVVVAETNTQENSLRWYSVIWLLVSEVSAHGSLTPLLLGL